MSIDIYCYFKALSLADVSYVAPLLSLVAIGNIFGAFYSSSGAQHYWYYRCDVYSFWRRTYIPRKAQKHQKTIKIIAQLYC